jgi:hypothetical protein
MVMWKWKGIDFRMIIVNLGNSPTLAGPGTRNGIGRREISFVPIKKTT